MFTLQVFQPLPNLFTKDKASMPQAQTIQGRQQYLQIKCLLKKKKICKGNRCLKNIR